MPASTPTADCMHARLVPDGDGQRCPMCGLVVPRHGDPAEAIAAMRARLRPDPEEAP